MQDGDRVYPVNLFILHHSTGSDFVNASDLEVQDWYSNIGRTRGYKGYAHSYHEHPSRPGVETFAQAQLTLREYTLDGNKYGWRVTELIKDPMNNVAWHAGNWYVNQRSLGIEICGNYEFKTLPDKALMCLADYLRPIDQALGGTLIIYGHREVPLPTNQNPLQFEGNVNRVSTACPGQILNQRDRIVEMINDPNRFNAELFPAPAPVKTWKDDCIAHYHQYITKENCNLYEIDSGKIIKPYEKGTTITVAYQYKDYYITSYSYDGNIKNGFKINELEAVKIEDVPVVVVPSPEPEKPAVKDEVLEVVKENNSLLKQIITFFKKIFNIQ